MIDLVRPDQVPEYGTGVPDVTSRPAPNTFEPGPDSPLKTYLSKLLEPAAAAPEPGPQPARADPVTEMVDPAPRAAPHNGRRNIAEMAKEPKPRWQTDEVLPETQAEPGAKPQAVPRPRPARKPAEGGRQRLMMALIPVLAIVFIAAVRNPLGKRPAVKTAGAAPRTSDPRAVPETEVAWTIPGVCEWGGRDPMQWTKPPAGNPPQAGAAPAEDSVELVVTGILYSEDRPSAIVNTQVVHQGQQVSGVTVSRIDRDGIEFERNGRKWRQGIHQ